MFIKGSSFVIRNINDDETESVLEVYKKCEDFLSLGPVNTASMKMVLDDMQASKENGGTFCGIYQGSEMVGVIDFVLSGFDGVGNHAYISLLMISKCHRRKGLGTEIVKLIEDEIMKGTRIGAILSGVQVNNIEAIQFWNKMGYDIVSNAKLMPDMTTVYDLRKDIVN